jgi:O-antigen ligase
MLGQVMAVGTLAATHCIRSGRHRARSVALLILFIVVGALSRSATSLFTIMVYCTLSLIVVLQAKSGAARMFAALLGILLVPLTLLSFVFMDDVLTLVGKDPTLTGRTELWQYALADIWQRPLLGWGYSAFWTPANEAAMEISLKLHWFVPQAHNGLLEILLAIGAAGAGYFIFLLGRNVWLAIKCLATPSRDFALSSLFFYGGLIATGVSEAVLMEPVQITTCLFFIMGLMCEKSLRRLPAPAFRRYRHAVPLRAA